MEQAGGEVKAENNAYKSLHLLQPLFTGLVCYQIKLCIKVTASSRAVNSKSSVGISSVTGRPVHIKGPTEPIIKESARRPVTEKLPTEPFYYITGGDL